MNFISKPNSYNPEINKSDESEPFQRLSKRSRPTCADVNLLVGLLQVGNKIFAGAVFFVDVVDVLVATAGKAYED